MWQKNKWLFDLVGGLIQKFFLPLSYWKWHESQLNMAGLRMRTSSFCARARRQAWMRSTQLYVDVFHTDMTKEEINVDRWMCHTWWAIINTTLDWIKRWKQGGNSVWLPYTKTISNWTPNHSMTGGIHYCTFPFPSHDDWFQPFRRFWKVPSSLQMFSSLPVSRWLLLAVFIKEEVMRNKPETHTDTAVSLYHF